MSPITPNRSGSSPTPPSLSPSLARSPTSAFSHTSPSLPPATSPSPILLRVGLPTSSSQDQLFHHARLKVHEADAEAIAEARRRILALGGDGSSPTGTTSPGMGGNGSEGEISPIVGPNTPGGGIGRGTFLDMPLPSLPPTPLHLSGLPPLPTPPSSTTRAFRSASPASSSPSGSRTTSPRINPNLNLSLPSSRHIQPSGTSPTRGLGIGLPLPISDPTRRSPLSQSVTFEQEQSRMHGAELDQEQDDEGKQEYLDYNSPHPSRSPGAAPWKSSVNHGGPTSNGSGSWNANLPKSYSQGDLVSLSSSMTSDSRAPHDADTSITRRSSSTSNGPDPNFIATQLPVPARASSMVRNASGSSQQASPRLPGLQAANPTGLSPVTRTSPRLARAFSDSSVQATKEGTKSGTSGVGGRVAVSGAGLEEEKCRAESVGLGIGGVKVGSRADQPAKTSSASYTLAVIGNTVCGKTTLIERAFRGWELSDADILVMDRDNPTISRYTSIVDSGTPARPRTVEVYEIDVRALYVPPGIKHPSIGGYDFPPFLPTFDGLIICYDAQSEASLTGLEHAVRDLYSGEPAIIAACKSDPDMNHVVTPHMGTRIAGEHRIGLVQVTNQTSQGKHKMRGSFGWILKAISRARHQQHARKPPQETANVTSPASRAVATSNSPPQTPGSELSHLSFTQYGTESEQFMKSKPPLVTHSQSGSDLSALPLNGAASAEAERSEIGDLDGTERGRQSHQRGSLEASGMPLARPRGGEADIAVSPKDGKGDTKPVLSVQIPPDIVSGGAQSIPGPAGTQLPSLLGRLMRAILGGGDNVFVNTFFLVFRRFTVPAFVMDELLSEWNSIIRMRGLEMQYRLLTRLNVLQLLTDWLIAYPGDFITEQSREACEDILKDALRYPELASACAQLADAYIDSADRPDLDTSWSVNDNKLGGPRTASLRPSATTSKDDRSGGLSATYSELDDTTQEAIAASRGFLRSSGATSETMESYILETPRSSNSQLDLALRPSHTRGSGSLNSGTHTSQMLQRTQSDTSRKSRRSSDGSQMMSDLSATEDRQLLRCLEVFDRLQELAIAIELTRIEWRAFAAVRPRDCLRTVLGGERGTPMTDMTNHFNHVTALVTTLVLGHSKPKLRSRIFEKLLSVAKQLKRQRNYATFYAVCVGLGNISVRRLHQTRAVLRPGVEAELEGLTSTMDPKAFFQRYRATLAQDIQAGQTAIPFTGIITQALVKAEAAKRNEDDSLKWDKCLTMADAIAPLALCQARGSPVAGMPGSELARQLIMGCPTLDDEASYRRSRFLEPEDVVPTGRFTRIMNRVDESITMSLGGSGFNAGGM